jgi:membrane-bound metal-dependent hydrolase YbcI (DUF457 family)
MNPGVLVFAAMLTDILLWSFVLLGWESASIPADYVASHQMQFTFPYSHSLTAAVASSLIAAAAAYFWYSAPGRRGIRPAVLVGAAVLSHWLLDALVHVPEIPLIGESSPKVGLGLWQHMTFALVVESLVLIVGLWMYLSGAPISRGKRWGMGILGMFVLASTIFGMTVAPSPPSVSIVAISSLITTIVVTALAAWLGAVRPKQRN